MLLSAAIRRPRREKRDHDWRGRLVDGADAIYLETGGVPVLLLPHFWTDHSLTLFHPSPRLLADPRLLTDDSTQSCRTLL